VGVEGSSERGLEVACCGGVIVSREEVEGEQVGIVGWCPDGVGREGG
jgi:hypothetical protein